jgi:hypothetical protein
MPLSSLTLLRRVSLVTHSLLLPTSRVDGAPLLCTIRVLKIPTPRADMARESPCVPPSPLLAGALLHLRPSRSHSSRTRVTRTRACPSRACHAARRSTRSAVLPVQEPNMPTTRLRPLVAVNREGTTTSHRHRHRLPIFTMAVIWDVPRHRSWLARVGVNKALRIPAGRPSTVKCTPTRLQVPCRAVLLWNRLTSRGCRPPRPSVRLS